MRKILIVSLAAAGLALGACSREDRTQVGEGAAAVGGEVKEAGAAIGNAGAEAADAVKDTAGDVQDGVADASADARREAEESRAATGDTTKR
jgi:hypothetical protein